MNIIELERLLDNFVPGRFVWLPYQLLESCFSGGVAEAKEWAEKRNFAVQDFRERKELGLARPIL